MIGLLLYNPALKRNIILNSFSIIRNSSTSKETKAKVLFYLFLILKSWRDYYIVNQDWTYPIYESIW